MINTEDFGGLLLGKRFLDFLDAKDGLQHDRNPPCKNMVGETVRNRKEIGRPWRNLKVTFVNCGNLIALKDGRISPEIAAEFEPGHRL
jgi:hypothetical protein